MATWVASLITLLAAVNSHNLTIVHEEHGLLLKAHGYLAMDATESMISIFRRIRIPQIERERGCTDKVRIDLNSNLLQTANEYIDNLRQLTSPTNLHKNSKRSIVLGVIALGLANMVISGIGYASLKAHINSVQHKFEQFQENQVDFDKSVLDVEKETIRIVQSLDHTLDNLQCEMIDNKMLFLAYQLQNQWAALLTRIFKPMTQGKLRIALTPETIALEELTSIIEQHLTLKDSLYAESPTILYSTGELSVVQAFIDISTTSIVVHQVLHFPMITRDNLFPL